MKYLFHIIFILLCTSCIKDVETSDKLFEQLPTDRTGVNFNNTLTVNDTMNYFKYGYFYMGGGVAVGDLNGDNFPEVFFTGNMVSNALYLNKGNFNFEDITESAGLKSTNLWHTGCTFGDVNNDGKLDILVSVSGIWNETKNLIYVNEGNNKDGIPQFKETASQLGLDDAGQTIQMAQLDYDQDGDLDVYVLNYPITPLDSKTPKYIKLVENPSWETSDHLYRNNGDGSFTDVTEAAGLIRFGLGIGIVCSDINLDGMTDIYVSNDFQTPDFFYVNNGDGTFTEAIYSSFQHTSFFGMGVDVGDINNDLLPDIAQVDMTTQDNYRSKANMASMDIPAFEMMVNSSLGYQYMYNSLQLNNGIAANGLPFFSNIAMFSGISSTDWSWTCLFADFDLDGLQDLFISNGTRKDINNKDYFKWLKQPDTRMKVRYNELSVQDLTKKMPSQKIPNYVFKNTGSKFKDVTDQWGLSNSGYSNGAAYADLDLDGDLDLVVNNIDEQAYLYENKSITKESNYLKIKLRQQNINTLAIGAKAFIYTSGYNMFKEQTLVRGYQSSIEPILHFGLGKQSTIDSVVVVWPNQTSSRLLNIKANQTIEIIKEQSKNLNKNINNDTLRIDKGKTIFIEVDILPSKHIHKENDFNDYKREVLIPHKMSSFGPALAVGDFNGDGKEDLFVGSAKDEASTLYIAQADGKFLAQSLEENLHEDVDAKFVDINGDNNLDLIIASGGNEIDNLANNYYNQRYYLNNGNGKLREAKYLPTTTNLSASKVFLTNVDDNPQNELFYLGRQVPGKYPLPASSYVVENLNEVSSTKSLPFKDIGMLTDAHWLDIDADKDMDVLLVGEWTGIRFFKNEKSSFEEEHIIGLSDQVGWWQDIEAADFDNDGDVDFIVANLGTNYKYQASETETFDLYSNDFDKDNDLEIVLSYYQDEEQYPVRGKQCSSEQMPGLYNRYPNYHSFASSNLTDIYGESNLKESFHLRSNNFRHTYIENKEGKLVSRPLPVAFQKYAINVIKAIDLNNDDYKDLVIAGNIFDSEAETPRSDALFGAVAINDGTGEFQLLPNYKTGLYIPYETRDLEFITINNELHLVVANNNGPLQFFRLNRL